MPEQAFPKLHSPTPSTDGPLSYSPHAYAELGVTSNFSFLRGASHPDELVTRAAELGYRAIGITDINSFAGIVRMHTAAKQIGLKMVVGVRLVFRDHPSLLAWPTDRAAYGRLCRMLTDGKRRAEKGNCDLSIADFLEHCQDVYAAVIPPDPVPDGFIHLLGNLKDAMGHRLSIAAALNSECDDSTALESLIGLSRLAGVPLLATNDVHYHISQRRALQDVLTCIRLGCTIHQAGFKLHQNAERYLKPPAIMHRMFANHMQAIHRGIEIAEQCTFNLDELRYEYPHELTPNGKTPLEYLTELAWDGAKKRYPNGVPAKVQKLVERELKLIGELKIEPYFLTVHDLVCYARSRNILCQGRGSAANSAVCYCLGVTSVDPDRIDVLFERFVSSARNEPPDIDIDFEHERREEVIQYVYEKYGRDRAGMTGVAITYRGRSAVRDVGKAMGLGLDTVDQMAKRLDWWDRGTLTPEKLREVGLDPNDRTVQLVIDLSGELLGFPRHLSQHVGGMVMTRGLLCELVPIENAAMVDRTVIEWDKDDIDALGILKVDLLALGMLTCIAKSLAFINQTNGGLFPLQMHTIPAEDPAVYDMLCDADSIGVFQVESRAQMSMLPRLRPREFYDLVIEVAIVRPGPIQGQMVHPYLRRRQGLEPVEFPRESLKKVLGKTLGVPLFQEQAMKIAIECAGFSPEEADRLRRAITGFRRYGDIETFAKKFIDGMASQGYDRDFADRCFAQLKGFASYGFPESHSASFALLVYVSSWIKRHHPAAFCAALLNSQPMGFYAPAQIVRDAQSHHVVVHCVDVNFSQWDCTLELLTSPTATNPDNSPGRKAGDRIKKTWPGPLDPRPSGLGYHENNPVYHGDVTVKWDWGRDGPGVRLGFRCIKGFRQDHAARICEIARKIGPFRSIDQFCRSTGLPSRALRLLAEADAFGSLGLSRRQATWEVIKQRDEELPLFASQVDDREPVVALPPMPIVQEVTTDYRTASLSLKRHPVALIRPQLDALKITTAAALANLPQGRWVKVAGIVLIRQRPGTASGIVFETLEDETGVVNLIIRPQIFDRHRPAARHASLVQADGYVERQGQVIHVMVKRMQDRSELLAGCEARSRDFR